MTAIDEMMCETSQICSKGDFDLKATYEVCRQRINKTLEDLQNEVGCGGRISTRMARATNLIQTTC